MFSKQQQEQGLKFLRTPLGDIGASEAQLAAFFTFLREEKKLTSDAMYRVCGKLRAGLSEFSHELDLPPFLISEEKYGLWMRKHSAAWKKDDPNLAFAEKNLSRDRKLKITA